MQSTLHKKNIDNNGQITTNPTWAAGPSSPAASNILM